MNWDKTELKGQIGSTKFEFKSPLIIYFGNHFIFGVETYLRREMNSLHRKNFELYFFDSLRWPACEQCYLRWSPWYGFLQCYVLD